MSRQPSDRQTIVAQALLRLSHPDWRVRQQAARDLARLADGSDLVAVQPLIEALRDAHNGVRQAVAAALGQIGARVEDSEETQAVRRRVVSALLGALGDGDTFVRQIAVQALGQIGDERAVPSLRRALHDRDARVVGAAADALASIGDQAALRVLVDGLAGRERHVQQAALRALARLDDEEAVPSVSRLLRSREAPTRLMAAEALGAIGARHPQVAWLAVRCLLQALDDPSAAVRAAVIGALGQAGSSLETGELLMSVVDELLDALALSGEAPIEEAAAHALGVIGSCHPEVAVLAQTDLIGALRSPAIRVRAAAAQALGLLGGPASVPSLVAYLADETRLPDASGRRVCDVVAEALLSIGTPEAMQAVREWRRQGL